MLKNEVIVPCGGCVSCVKRRQSAWSFRLQQQYKICNSSQFITLTYDTDHVPITKNGFMSLKPRDLQLFFKRLRKVNDKDTLKYYAVGEYGGKFKRPHYHAILFNAKIETIQDAWCTEGREPVHLGNIHYGSVNAASIGYCLKYMQKGVWRPRSRNDDREGHFSRMSKGLGKNYLTPAMQAWHKKDVENRMYCNLADGKKISMPRYYKDKLYSEEERQLVEIAFMSKQKSMTDEELHVHFKNIRARQELVMRKNYKN